MSGDYNGNFPFKIEKLIFLFFNIRNCCQHIRFVLKLFSPVLAVLTMTTKPLSNSRYLFKAIYIYIYKLNWIECKKKGIFSQTYNHKQFTCMRGFAHTYVGMWLKETVVRAASLFTNVSREKKLMNELFKKS